MKSYYLLFFTLLVSGIATAQEVISYVKVQGNNEVLELEVISVVDATAAGHADAAAAKQQTTQQNKLA